MQSSCNFITLFLKESYSRPAKSSLVISPLQARSGLPTSPMNKVSPVKTLNEILKLNYTKILYYHLSLIYSSLIPKYGQEYGQLLYEFFQVVIILKIEYNFYTLIGANFGLKICLSSWPENNHCSCLLRKVQMTTNKISMQMSFSNIF